MDSKILFFFNLCESVEDISEKLENISFKNGSKVNLDIYDKLDDNCKLLFLNKLYESNKKLYEKFVCDYSNYLAIK